LIAEVDINSGESVYGLYTIHIYKNVTLLLLNRSALRYLDGFWVVILGDIDVTDIGAKILYDVVEDPIVEVLDVVVENGELRMLRGEMTGDVWEVVSVLIDAGLRDIMIRISILRGGSLWLMIDRRGFEELDVEKLLETLTDVARERKVAIQEVIGVCSIPSYFDARDMYESMVSLPCFSSFSEGAYGVAINFDLKCAQRMASEKGTSLDQVVENIVSGLWKVMPLVRKYVP